MMVSTNVIGSPYWSHLKKSIVIPDSSSKPADTAFVELAIMVPIPPTAAEMEIPSNKALLILDFSSELNRGNIAATTMAAVAVYDINMENVIVVNMMAMSILVGLVPDIFNVRLSSRLSKPVFVIAAAIKNPPNSNQITLLEKVFTYRSMTS